MATLMLEGGADIRFIQQMLGHAELSTTQVSIRALKAIHTATHPGAANRPHRAVDPGDDPERTAAAEELLDVLDDEAAEEHDDEHHNEPIDLATHAEEQRHLADDLANDLANDQSGIPADAPGQSDQDHER